VTTGASAPTEAVVLYLCDREIAADAQTLIVDEVRARFADATAAVNFERIPASIGALAFARNQTSLNAAAATLDRAGQILQQHPNLRVEIAASREPAEPEKLAEQRAQAVADYLTSKWQVAAERIAITLNAEPSRTVKLGLKVEEASS
jgi:outer membrane protein OmpA-like peptidoglycan-associated protein